MQFSIIVLCVLIVLSTFPFWEFLAWFTNKYVMHGFLWRWHRSHNTVHNHRFEWDDLFAVIFSIPCIGLLFYATQISYNPYLISVGTGIFFYGGFYFFFMTSLFINELSGILKGKANIFGELSMHTMYIIAGIQKRVVKHLVF